MTASLVIAILAMIAAVAYVIRDIGRIPSDRDTR